MLFTGDERAIREANLEAGRRRIGCWCGLGRSRSEAAMPGSTISSRGSEEAAVEQWISWRRGFPSAGDAIAAHERVGGAAGDQEGDCRAIEPPRTEDGLDALLPETGCRCMWRWQSLTTS